MAISNFVLRWISFLPTALAMTEDLVFFVVLTTGFSLIIGAIIASISGLMSIPFVYSMNSYFWIQYEGYRFLESLPYLLTNYIKSPETALLVTAIFESSVALVGLIGLAALTS